MGDRDEIMRQWDDIRAVIAGGNKSSGPRDWFEGVLDDRDAEIDRLKAALREIANMPDQGPYGCVEDMRDVARKALEGKDD